MNRKANKDITHYINPVIKNNRGIRMSKNMYLGWIDYTMLIFFLGLSACIGIWHGCFGNKQRTPKDFHMGGQKMSMFPTALSLFATLCSASTMLGIPVEIYYYGTMYIYFAFAWLLCSIPTSYIFLPKFRELKLISIYNYLENRFSYSLRLSATLTYIFSNILFMSAILYGPCLALNQVTGLNIWFSIISCGIICTFYTSIGGMKAVIWSDVFQSFIMFLGVILSIIFGFIDVGGVTNVVERAIAGQRLNMFSNAFQFDPTIRYTFWSTIIGGTFYATACSCVLQSQVQRYMSVKSTRDAQRATWVNNSMCFLLLILCGTVGLLIYAKYYNCDPLLSKMVSKSDQFYPLFIMETFSSYPGLTGLFIASIMSGSLSSISSGVNSIAAVIMEDIWKHRISTRTLSDEDQTKISKYISVALGLLTILLTFCMPYLTNILVIVYSVIGALSGPIFGIFILGFFFPRVNNRSASIGFYISLIFQLWVVIGANFTRHQQIKRILPVSIDGCQSFSLTNTTISSTTIIDRNNLFLPLYSISIMWYAFNGVMLALIIGLVTSLLCGNSKSDIEKIDRSLFISFCWKKNKDLKSSQNMLQNDGTHEESNELINIPSSQN